MIINGLIIGGPVALAALGGYGVWLWLRADDRHEFPEPEHPGFGDITPEIVHDAPWPPAQPPAVTVRDLTHRQYPLAPDSGRAARAAHASAAHGTPARAIPSPATPPAPAPGHAPGTAAAAGDTHPSPPPLPAHVAACPERYPFEEWLRDDVAEAAIKDGAYAQVMASYHKSLDGAS